MGKKIIVNGSIIHEKPTGLGIYAINIIKELSKDKNIEVYSPVDIDGVDIKKTSKYVKPSYKKIGGLMRFLWTQFVLPFKGEKDDIIYHPFQYLSFFSRKKQIITIHDFIPIYYPNVAKHQNIYYKYIMPVLIKRAYKIICISENTKKDLISLYNVDVDKVKVIYNGYDENLFNNKGINEEVIKKYKLNKPYMVMVGAGYSHKNLEVVIEAFKSLKEEKLELVIVGGNSDYIVKLKELVKKYQLENIIFTGYVPDKDLKDLYGNSEAFLYPTLYEGFGLPILEAQACGTAVICSNNSSLPEVYGNSAISFNPEDVNSVKDAIKILIKDNELRGKLIKEGYKNIKRFSWGKTASEIKKIIE